MSNIQHVCIHRSKGYNGPYATMTRDPAGHCVRWTTYLVDEVRALLPAGVQPWYDVGTSVIVPLTPELYAIFK